MVDILLATYNGAKYVEMQILSIIGQTYKDWQLFIHDDGSTDETVQIILKLQKIDDRIHLIQDGVKFGGAPANFMHLLKFSTAPYIMFCDQDDIWFDNKIKLMYERISQIQSDKPKVAYSNSYVWKEKQGILGLATLVFPKNLKSFLFLNSGMQGCVSIFDDKMRTLMLEWDGELSMHDHLLHLIGLSLGIVDYMNLPLMLYRNHDQNVTKDTRTSLFDLKSIIKSRTAPVVDILHYTTIKLFFDKYYDLLDLNTRNVLKSYLDLPNKKMIPRLFLILEKRFSIYNSIFVLISKVILKPYIG